MNSFLLLTQDEQFDHQLTVISKKANWQIEHVTTPTGLVVELSHHTINGIFWDQRSIGLDTTIATMTLIRNQIKGPIIIFSAKNTERIKRKLYQTHIDDVMLPTEINQSYFTCQIEQRLWLYQQTTIKPTITTTSSASRQQLQKIGDWEINHTNYTVNKNGQEILLTPKEFQLLTYLMDHKGHVLSRDQLVNGVWGYDLLDTSRIVDIHISHLRDKLEDDSQHPVHLLTVRGFGYKLI